jgi:predicted nucleotidyltransferase
MAAREKYMLFELEVFRDVIAKLNSNSIPYMISGSVALNYYTIPRMTRDIDIVIELNDIDNFYKAFKEEYYIDYAMVSDALKKQHMFNIIHLEEVIKIDFIIKKDTEYRKTEFERRNQIDIDDLKVFIVSIEDLIISKLLWAKDSKSEIQINDVKNLMKEKIDFDYIQEWVNKLNISVFFKEINRENQQ